MAGLAKKIVHLLLLLAIGGIFVFAGILKAIHPAAFAMDIDHYHVLPRPAVFLLALYLPWLEIVCGLMLATQKYRMASLAILAGMTLVFLGALISAVVRGLDVSCGCFGGGAGHGYLGMAIARDLAIFAAIVVRLICERQKERL